MALDAILPYSRMATSKGNRWNRGASRKEGRRKSDCAALQREQSNEISKSDGANRDCRP